MKVPLPLIVTGIAGVCGYNAFRYFRALYPGQVFGIRRQDYWPLSGDGILGINSDDADGMRDAIQDIRPAAVLNSEGSCALKGCELDPEMARRINVASVENLLAAIDPDVRLVHLSIDLVFSGIGPGGYTEDYCPQPVTVYGKTMLEGESIVRDRRPDACVLRISLPMGVSFNGHAGAIDWIQSRFKNDRPATLYIDEVRTPTYTDCMNQLFERLLSGDLAGLYHCGGPRRLSLYQIAQIVNRVTAAVFPMDSPELRSECFQESSVSWTPISTLHNPSTINRGSSDVTRSPTYCNKWRSISCALT